MKAKQRNNKPSPFYAPGSTDTITQEDLDRRRRKYNRLLSIGIDPTLITDNSEDDEHENPYRVAAMVLINQDKDVPQEMIDKMKKYDVEHTNITKKNEGGNSK